MAARAPGWVIAPLSTRVGGMAASHRERTSLRRGKARDLRSAAMTTTAHSARAQAFELAARMVELHGCSGEAAAGEGLVSGCQILEDTAPRGKGPGESSVVEPRGSGDE